LLSVIHGGIDADLRDGLGWGCRDRVADGEIDGRGGLDDAAGTTAGGDSGAVDDAR
jgi:hypothetical protein